MSNTKLDKASVCTAFACAVASFALGFAFCLSLLGNSGSCYLLIKDFWYSTRGYVLFDRLKNLKIPEIPNIAEAFALFLVVSAVLVALIVLFSSFRGRKDEDIDDSPIIFPHLPDKKEFAEKEDDSSFADESDVKRVLRDCRINPEASSWQSLESMPPAVLAQALKYEYPLVSAIVLSKLTPKKSAKILAELGADLSAEITAKMLKLRPVDMGLFGTLGRTLADNIISSQGQSNAQKVAQIMSFLPPEFESELFSNVKHIAPEALSELAKKDISFEDLYDWDEKNWKSLIEQIGEPKLVIALRGASDKIRAKILEALPHNEGAVIEETLKRLGPVKLRDIEKAQNEIISAAKDKFGFTGYGHG
ncbi:MAG: hypothetical protein IJ689_07940 [Alphaproteobacteria bacterium]|nr:hypothetical protein [Alphaproteobacteria bacterium]MBR1649506.1 hypothetical protein [Alphaproteobacteria bacterium]